ncbi:MAG: hypothetical protein PHI35_05150 [Victivallaceae bacterium]|nr:hypothetical protein [Victivallaceae bacterium]
MNNFLQEFFFILPFLALAGLFSPRLWSMRRDPVLWFVAAAIVWVMLSRGGPAALSHGFSARYWIGGVVLLLLPGAVGFALPAELTARWSRRAAKIVLIACFIAVAVIGVIKALRAPTGEKSYLRNIAADIVAKCPDVTLNNCVYVDRDDYKRVKKYNPEIGETIRFYYETEAMLRSSLQPRLARGKAVFVMLDEKVLPTKILPHELVFSEIARYRSGRHLRSLMRVWLRTPPVRPVELMAFIPEKLMLAAGKTYVLPAHNFTAIPDGLGLKLAQFFWPRYSDRIPIGVSLPAGSYKTEIKLVRGDGVVFEHREWKLILVPPRHSREDVAREIGQIPEASRRWTRLPVAGRWFRIASAGEKLELPPDRGMAALVVMPPPGWGSASAIVRGEFLRSLAEYENELKAKGYYHAVILPWFLLWTPECDASPAARDSLLSELTATWLDNEDK